MAATKGKNFHRGANQIELRQPAAIFHIVPKMKNIVHKQYLLVFCYQNCFDLTCEKIILVIEKNFCNSKLNAKNLQGQNNFW